MKKLFTLVAVFMMALGANATSSEEYTTLQSNVSSYLAKMSDGSAKTTLSEALDAANDKATAGEYDEAYSGLLSAYNTAKKGDVNHDGKINVTDVMMAVDIAQNAKQDGKYYDEDAADMNDNGSVIVTDVMKIVDKAQ